MKMTLIALILTASSLASAMASANTETYFCADGLSAAYLVKADLDNGKVSLSAAGENQGSKIEKVSSQVSAFSITINFTEDSRNYELIVALDGGESVMSNIVNGNKESRRTADCHLN